MCFQIADSVTGGLYSFLVTGLILFVLNLIPGCALRMEYDKELQGVDDAEIGEYGVSCFLGLLILCMYLMTALLLVRLRRAGP